MKFPMTKMAAAVTLAAMASGAQAVPVTSWQLGDFDNDGWMSDFAMLFTPTNGDGVNEFGPTGELCGASPCAAIATDGSTQGVNAFTMGFNYGGQGFIKPFTFGTGVQADITNGVLTFSSLSLGAQFAGQNLDLFPDSWSVTKISDLGGGNYGVVVDYRASIVNAASTLYGLQSEWRLEGVMAIPTAVPEAETYGMLLAGLGLVGFMARRRAAMVTSI